jgi:hypothetical protein
VTGDVQWKYNWIKLGLAGIPEEQDEFRQLGTEGWESVLVVPIAGLPWPVAPALPGATSGRLPFQEAKAVEGIPTYVVFIDASSFLAALRPIRLFGRSVSR